VIPALLAAFGAVFLAELPDKTMFATLVLTTRFRRPLAVWTGAVTAFAFHVVLAVTLGSFLRRLPDRPMQIGVGVLFLVGAALLWREEAEGEEAEEVVADAADRAPFGAVALRCAAVLGVAEFGDLTQLATAGLASSTGEPLAVAIGALSALAAVAALAVLAGRWMLQRVPLRLVRRVAAFLFAGFGVAALVLGLT
jgi:putative Ca2+/H+ antiporter (TMEM165/GDT1 family)